MMQVLERLRRAREEHGLDIDGLARRTRLRAHLLEAVEQGRWDELPRGVYARAVVRAYAEAVGFDPNRLITEVAPFLPEAEDALDGMARVHKVARASARDANARQPPEERTPAAPASTMPARARAAAAAAIDAALLAAFVLVTIVATAAVGGVQVAVVVDVAAPAVGAIALLVSVVYFVLLGGIGGATLGARVVGQPAPPPVFRGTASTAARRAWSLLLRESSIVMDVLLPWPQAERRADTRAGRRSGTSSGARAAVP